MRAASLLKATAAAVLCASCGHSPTAPKPYPDLPPSYIIPPEYIDNFTDSTLVEGVFAPDSVHPNFTWRDADTYSPGGGVSAPVNPPASGPYIGEIRYPAGMTAGSAPAHLYSIIGGQHWTHMYLAYTIQLSSNWYGQSSGTNKIGYVWIHSNPSVFLVAHGIGTSALRWEVDLQNVASGAARLTDNLGANALVTRGLWQRVELELISNTPGQPDGIVRAWLTDYDRDGRLVGSPRKILEYTDIEFASAGQSNVWESVTWYPIWGGVGGTVPATQYQWMDRLALGGL